MNGAYLKVLKLISSKCGQPLEDQPQMNANNRESTHITKALSSGNHLQNFAVIGVFCGLIFLK